MTSNNPIFDARVVLPGLNLTPSSKEVVVPDSVTSVIDDGSIVVFLKKFDGNLSIFRDQKILLCATYQSRGTPQNSGVNDEKHQGDDNEPGEDEEEPWEKELDDEFNDQPYENILVEEWEWANKRIDSPSIDGYDSFLIKPGEAWKSTEKSMEEVVLCFYFTETDILPSESLLSSENRVVEVGESFVIDVTDDSNPISNRVILLEWDFNCTLMKEVFSPKEKEVLKRESEICDEVLLLGMHGGQNFQPSKNLVLHVHLNEYLSGGQGNLKLKLYNNCEIEPDAKKTFDEMVDGCIQKSCEYDSVGSFSASGIFGDYITFDIDSNSLIQILEGCSKGSDDNLISVLEEQNDEVKQVQTIIDAIEAAQFAAVIEDENSRELVAKFLLSSITSNSIFFDNAVQMLKSPKNRSFEIITDWSMMVTKTAESIWDSIYTDADYKLTRSESKLLETGDNALQEFLVTIALPEINADVATIDPYNDVEILVENCDPDLSFFDRNENRDFLQVRNPTRKPMSGDDHMIEFKWNSIDRRGIERECEIKVSILIGREGSRQQKIGRTISIFREVGGENKQHTALVRLRNMVKMGFENASGFQCCFSHFLETMFKTVFALSTNEEQSISSRLFLEKAADDIASRFYKSAADRKSDIYEIIQKSPTFSPPNFEDIENVKVIAETDIAELMEDIFGKLNNEMLLIWAASLKLDEDSLSFVDDNESIDDLYEKHVGNLRRVLRMDSTELAAQLKKHPKLMENFVTAVQLIRDEIDNPTIDLPPTRESDLAQMLSESSAKEIEFQTQEILANIEEQILFTPFSDKKDEGSEVLTENVSTLETNLLQMLETTADSCETGIDFLEDSQVMLENISTLLTKLRNFGSNVKTLSSNATSLTNFVTRFWNAIKSFSNVCVGPLAAIKTIVSAIKVPMQMILRALKNGKAKISSLGKKIDTKLKKLVDKSMIDKIDKVSQTIGKPKTALEKVVEIVDMLISVASLGVLPASLISEFASSNSLSSFFSILSRKIGTVKLYLESAYEQTTRLEPHLTSMRNLSNSVASKFNFLRPLDAGLKKFQPFADTIQGLYRRFSGWLRRLLAAAMWPVEQTINALLYPFRAQINRMIAELNPFGKIDDLTARLVAPLNNAINDTILTGQLNLLESFQNMTISEELKEPFKQMAKSFTLCVAIIQRGFYGLLEGLLIQGSNDVGFFQELMGAAEVKTIKQLLVDMQKESAVVTMGDAIINMKKSIDSPLEMCDSYLLMHASNDRHTFIDDFTDHKLASYVKRSDYDLTHCAINPSLDKASALFEYGKTEDGSAKNSWVMASIAAILHHSRVTGQAEQIGILAPDSTILTPFIPEDQGGGKYTISLHPKLFMPMQMYDVDSRLPIRKVVYPSLESFEEFPTDIFDYANERIRAEVYPIFSEKYSFALIEKLIACELNMTETESVGTAMHLLSGNVQHGFCHKRESNRDEWMRYNCIKADSQTEKYDRVALQLTDAEKKTENELVNYMKSRSMSKEQVELLDSLYHNSLGDEKKTATAYDRSSLEEAMQDLTIFVVVASDPSRSAFPILYTDNTPKTHLVYADGPQIKPLLNLSVFSEVWEYSISGFHSKPNTILGSLETKIQTGEVTPRVTTATFYTNPWITRLSSGDDGIPETGTDSSIGRLIGPLLAHVRERGAVPIFKRAIMTTMDQVSSSNNKSRRTIFKGDYVKKTKSSNLYKVIKVNVTKKDIGKGPDGKKRYRTVTENYTATLVLSRGSKVETLEGMQTKKLTYREELNNDKILRNEKIFYGKGLAQVDLTKQADRRRALQWPVDTKQNVKYCGMTLRNLKDYVDHCKERYPFLWLECKNERGTNKFVSVNDLCETFIKPHTSSSEACIALNMKDVLGSTIKKAEVFVSLSWEENIEQVIKLLYDQIGETKIGRPGRNFTEDTVIWLSPFSIYQGGGRGSLQDQLLIGVFQEITKSVTDMFVIQTGVCNSYSRLWCVSEFSAAADNNEVKIHHLFSSDWRDKYIRTQNKGFAYDWKEIEYNGTKSNVLRKLFVDEDLSTKIRIAGSKVPEYFTSVNYFLMEEEEWGEGPGVGGAQPILRLNVMEGLSKNGMNARNVDKEEFGRIDNSVNGKYQNWWRLQKTIVDLERRAAGATADLTRSVTLSQQFTEKYEPGMGTNFDIVRRVENNKDEYDEKSRRLLDGYVPVFTKLDERGRRFLQFQKDEQATTYFKEVIGLNPDYEPADVKNLLSFGANVELLGNDRANFEFPNIERLARLLDCTYVDSLRLPPLAASYKLAPDEDGVAHPRNVFWAEYYKKAMVAAKTMTFVITGAWVNSKNCFEELEWAAALRSDRSKYKTLFVFTKRNHFKELEDQDTFRFVIDGKVYQYNWTQLKTALGFTGRPIVAPDVESIAELVGGSIRSFNA
ncbi:unnamed protein product [Pseudo-nitzschia multistriata]|uniref:Uncharacterized protein n=1 Tax=Pseudo-nitzschia multistriata TaxID=183589 RepID=A0A448ZTF1_9STRA|nr:unnamed protein product [Pseudo-nitzschia multistriata]